ncbi:AcrR family transcriptional regulator [Desulfosalsimonas propionicica]|uniref:AcrR family transcriptional regulator n=1 Tax=Desulfosalsimonas propionicica TaxID=332175 RepID=A0A7W0HM33_9BACT|nr:TetR/AcrR family transcriptional regulator [Desulfosalsimonas propionicica]MBA2882979.1 AcrR family transcriptional regulator [Desulfosalsimonas propionicica]
MAQNIVDKSKEKYHLYEQRHREILDAAISIFNNKGYKAATTASIANAASISEPTLYKHFKNKKYLFIACFHSIVDYLFSENKKIYKQNPDDEISYLQGVIRIYFDFVKEHQDKSMFLVHMLSYKNDPELRAIYHRVVQAHQKHIESVLMKAKEKDKIKTQLDLNFLAAIFASQYYSVVAVKDFVSPKSFRFENFYQFMADLLKITV